MASTKKSSPKGNKVLTPISEFEQTFFPRAYQEKQKELDEDNIVNLGIAADLLGEVQRQLPKKKKQKAAQSKV